MYDSLPYSNVCLRSLGRIKATLNMPCAGGLGDCYHFSDKVYSAELPSMNQILWSATFCWLAGL